MSDDRKPATVISVDLETTGLDDERDVITEVGWVYRGPSDEEFGSHYRVEYAGTPQLWSARNTSAMDSDVGRWPLQGVLRTFFATCERLSLGGERDLHLLGLCPAFDDRHLRRVFPRELPYHYHVIDVEAMGMGALGWPTPRPIAELRAALGMTGENPRPHHALEDAREALAIYHAILALPPRAPAATS